MNLTDNEIIKALECCVRSTSGNDCEKLHCPACKDFGCHYMDSSDRDDSYEALLEGLGKAALDLIKRQQADKERLEIELQAMRNAANSYKSRVKTFEMDNAQLHSDIVNANQNFDHIKNLWEAEKEKVESAKIKLINACKELQAAKAEIERLQKTQQLIKTEAIKEFAERLKNLTAYYWLDNINRGHIDNLVKEMTSK